MTGTEPASRWVMWQAALRLGEPHTTPQQVAQVSRLVALVLSLLLLLSPTPVGAQEPPLLSHTYAYADVVTFRLSLVDHPEVPQATLLLQVNGVSTDGDTVAVQAGSASVTRDLERAPFPPFAEITYWWVFETPGGGWRETDKQTFQYTDNRYTWKSVVSDAIRVHWIVGEANVMAQALDVAKDTAQALASSLSSPAQREISIYVYPSETDLASALQLGGQRWVSGIAYAELGVVLVAAPPNSEALTAVQRDIPHEMTHQALYDVLGPQGYGSLPTWLSEGLATLFEASPDPAYARALEAGLEAHDLIPLVELCAPFPDEPARARLAYAQSGSLVQYIRLQQGWSGIRDLLAAYADGQACSTGTRTALGLDLAQLEKDWVDWLRSSLLEAPEAPTRSSAALVPASTAPWVLIVGALLVSPLLILIVGRRR